MLDEDRFLHGLFNQFADLQESDLFFQEELHRHFVCGIQDATSHEFFSDSKTRNYVIDTMVEQRGNVTKGGTMRLGAYPCDIKKDTLAYTIYGKKQISERHRHRWEFNNKYLADFEKAGLVASGKNPDTNLVEIVELKGHPFFIGVQYHPELKSTVENPQPIFVHFIKAAKAYLEKKESVKNPLLQSEMI